MDYEIDYEKMYNEALKRAKAVINVAANQGETQAAIETIFPELRESEDERIRKIIFNCVYECCDTGYLLKDDRDSVVSWLEKQKCDRMKPIYDARESFESALEKAWKDYDESGSRTVDSCEDDYVECVHAKGFREGFLFGLEKQKEPEIASASTIMIPSCWEEKEQRPAEDKYYSSPDCGTTAGCTNDESEYDKGHRAGKAYQLKQTEQYKIGKTFTGLIPCWVNAPSELQPAHNYHGKNIVAMHENNGGFRCVCVDDEKPTTFHLPEDTLLVEGWRKEQKPVEWSEEDEKMRQSILNLIRITFSKTYRKEINWLESLRPQPRWKPSEDEERLINTSISFLKDFADKGYENAVECIDWLKSKLNGNTGK